MRLTYTDIKDQYLVNIGKAGSTDASIIAELKLNMGQRYQMILSKLRNFTTQTPQTASTVADQQYYHYPPGLAGIDSITITVGSIKWPLEPIYSQSTWDQLNAIAITGSVYPQFYFQRRDDFGIWPIPSDAHTMTLNNFIRDRNITIADYTDGTVAVTSDSATITGTDTTWTAAMVGRWFCVTSESNTGQGLWYRVKTFSSSTSLVLESVFEGATGSSLTYRIGQSPEIPEEGHVLLLDGPTSDFYAGRRSEIEKSTWFNNKFWTGDGQNSSRDEGDDKIAGGLIGLMRMYKSRDKRRLILRQPQRSLPNNKLWATTIS